VEFRAYRSKHTDRIKVKKTNNPDLTQKEGQNEIETGKEAFALITQKINSETRKLYFDMST
jgi:hypothetical protein